MFVATLALAMALLVVSPWLIEWVDEAQPSAAASREWFRRLERFNTVLIHLMIGGWVFALGSCMASFLNVVAYRLPRGRGILGRSSCPCCRQPLSFLENMPVFGWLRNGGRCKTCLVAISARYLWVELALGAIYLALFLTDVGIRPLILALQGSAAGGDVPLIHSVGIFAVHALVASALFVGFLTVLEIRGGGSPRPIPVDDSSLGDDPRG